MTRLRQIALVAKDMNLVQTHFYNLFGLSDAHIDPKISKFGLQNIVMTLGDTFLEVVSPITDNTTAGRLLERRGGDGGYMVIVQVDDLLHEKQRVESADIRIVFEAFTERGSAIHLHPKDVPGAIASLDQMDPPEAWYWAGSNWMKRKAMLVENITGSEIQCESPTEIAEKWAIAYNLPVSMVGGVPRLLFDDGEVRFVEIKDSRGIGLRAFDVVAKDKKQILKNANQLKLKVVDDSIEVCGVTVNLK